MSSNAFSANESSFGSLVDLLFGSALPLGEQIFQHTAIFGGVLGITVLLGGNFIT
jgi:hypothetical protein